MRALVLIFAATVGWFSMTASAHACTCLPPDMGRSYNNAEHVVHVSIQQSLGQSNGKRRYLARLVENDFKGCLKQSRTVVIQTASSSAACGVTLSVGREYLLHGDNAGSFFGWPVLAVGSCDANTLWSNLSEEHAAFLDSRYVCCGGRCGCADGTQPVACFVNPCVVSSCDVEGAECTANYCGGCNAEWYTESGALVCEDGASASSM